ncbi:unnamed protein product, partial [Adineta steineri]
MSLIKDNILIGVISKSLLDLTQDQCICEMLNSDESIYALNYFSTNQTCQLLYSNITSTIIEFSLNSSLIYMNQSSISLTTKSTTALSTTTVTTSTRQFLEFAKEIEELFQLSNIDTTIAT